MKKQINSILRAFGVELHGIGYLEKLRNSSVHKNEWDKQKELLKGTARVIFDVGANRGDTTAEYVSLFPTAMIHAFEPYPEACESFRIKHSHNRQVALHQCALSNRVGSAHLNINRSIDTNSLLKSSEIGLNSDRHCETLGTLEVPTETLDSFCIRQGIDEIDILKMDVQGSELDVLKGAEEYLRADRIKLIYTELFFASQYVDQPLFDTIFGFLRQYGFVLQDIYDPFYSSTQLVWCDAIFLSRKHFS
jgi:FkbM family methyltransferase